MFENHITDDEEAVKANLYLCTLGNSTHETSGRKLAGAVCPAVESYILVLIHLVNRVRFVLAANHISLLLGVSPCDLSL